MTKTTSYEISKKLKEAGFDAESSFFWCELGKDLIRIHISQSHSVPESIDKIKAYDLETILDALPDFIIRKYKSKVNWEVKAFRERLIIEKKEIRYSCDDIENADDANRFYQEYGYMQDITVFKKFNDNSLADTAGKMWLMLKEKGLV